jgi:hypothetical protein
MAARRRIAATQADPPAHRARHSDPSLSQTKLSLKHPDVSVIRTLKRLRHLFNHSLGQLHHWLTTGQHYTEVSAFPSNT